jgi:hypothetical protein
MDKNKPGTIEIIELNVFRAEASALLKLNQKK